MDMSRLWQKGASDAPLVSINCITYNHARYIRQTLDGFFMQETSFPFEILLHDDASTDETQAIVREYEERYPGVIHPIYQTENQYSRGNTNINYMFNYTRARGRYIAYCEGDDYWTDPHKLQKQVDYMEAHPECSLCFHAILDVNDDGERIREFRAFSKSRTVGLAEILAGIRQYAFVSYMFRTEHIRNLPAFYFTCPVGDLPLTLILADRGSVYYMNDLMACYRNAAAGSWTSRLHSGDSAAAKVHKHTLQMHEALQAFDDYTGGKYAAQIAVGHEKLTFNELGCYREFRKLLAPKYRRFFKQMSLQVRLGTVAGALFPWLTPLLEKIYRRLIS